MTGLERRTLLGAVGAGTLGTIAGCFEFLESEDGAPSFDADEFESVLATELPERERPAPVQPSEEAVDDAVGRLDELIATVPDPLEADDVPNEPVRNDIDRMREIARNRRDELAESDRFHAMRRGATARLYAGNAATAFDAVAGDYSRDDLAARRDEIRTRLAERRAAIERVGADPQQGILLFRWLEDEIETAERYLDDRLPRDGADALAIGKAGGRVERAAAATEFLAELHRRHVVRLADARSLETPFEDALAASLEEISSTGRLTLPTDMSTLVEEEVSDTPARRVLAQAMRPLVRRTRRTISLAGDGRTATALWSACAFERNRRAFEAIREEVDAGSHRTIATIDDVRDVRESALERADSLPFDHEEPSLGGDHLAYLCDRIADIDDVVREEIEIRESIDPTYSYADYLVRGAQLEALPDAVATLERRLE